MKELAPKANGYNFKILDLFLISSSALHTLNLIKEAEAQGDIQKLQNSLKGMLKLTLSDGTKEMKAMEYTPINGLSLMTAPGTMINVKCGKIQNGILMLRSENVQIVGSNEINVKEAIKRLKNRLYQHLSIDPPEKESVGRISIERVLDEDSNATKVVSNSNATQAQTVSNSNVYCVNSNATTLDPSEYLNSDDFFQSEDDGFIAQVDQVISNSQHLSNTLQIKVVNHNRLRMDQSYGFILPLTAMFQGTEKRMYLGNQLMESLLGMTLSQVNDLKKTAEGRRRILESSNSLAKRISSFQGTVEVDSCQVPWADLQDCTCITKLVT